MSAGCSGKANYYLLMLVMSAACKSAIEKQIMGSKFIVDLSYELNHHISQVCQD